LKKIKLGKAILIPLWTSRLFKHRLKVVSERILQRHTKEEKMLTNRPFIFTAATWGLFLSLVFSLQIPIQAQTHHPCFLIDQEGKVIDLSSICGSSFSPNNYRVINHSNNDNSSKSDSEENHLAQYNTSQSSEEIRNVLPSAVSLALTELELQELYQMSKVPDYLEGAINQEKYENRPKCQFIAERVREDPSLLEPTVYFEPSRYGRSIEGIDTIDTNTRPVGIVSRCRDRL
jgi:hypothetical protein